MPTPSQKRRNLVTLAFKICSMLQKIGNTNKIKLQNCCDTCFGVTIDTIEICNLLKRVYCKDAPWFRMLVVNNRVRRIDRGSKVHCNQNWYQCLQPFLPGFKTTYFIWLLHKSFLLPLLWCHCLITFLFYNSVMLHACSNSYITDAIH